MEQRVVLDLCKSSAWLPNYCHDNFHARLPSLPSVSSFRFEKRRFAKAKGVGQTHRPEPVGSQETTGQRS